MHEQYVMGVKQTQQKSISEDKTKAEADLNKKLEKAAKVCHLDVMIWFYSRIFLRIELRYESRLTWPRSWHYL